MAIFTGAAVALVTPFDKEGKVNYDMIKILIERQILEGSDAIVVCGTTGEPATLSDEEMGEIYRTAVWAARKRVPVIAGCGSNCTKHAIELARMAQKVNCDGLLVVTPYYNKATQNGLYEHFSRIAEATDLPMILYNVPQRTGCNLMAQTAQRLARDCDTIVGIKEASGNLSALTELFARTEGLLDVYSGNDDAVLPVLSLGGKGVISVFSNVMPSVMHEMVAAYLAKDLERARYLQLHYLDKIKAMFLEVNPIPVKAALCKIGFDVGGYRLPLTPLSKEQEEIIGQLF